MSKTITTMRVTDTQVIADSMNPREDFGDLEKLADSFAVNPAFPGEPFNPPVLVRDGETFKIVDGERRIRAMRLLGLETYNAIVCDDMDAANTMLAMVATDDKLQLTEVERSRGVQQALLLGVSAEKVEKSLHVRGAAKVKHGMELAGEKAAELTLDHMLALDEFADDENRVKKILKAKDASALASLTNSYRNEDVVLSEVAVLRAAAVKCGVAICEDKESKAQMESALDEDMRWASTGNCSNVDAGEDGSGYVEFFNNIKQERETDKLYIELKVNQTYWNGWIYAAVTKNSADDIKREERDLRSKDYERAIVAQRESWERFLAANAGNDPRFALSLKSEALKETICYQLYKADSEWVCKDRWNPFTEVWFNGKSADEIEVSEQDACCTGLLEAALLDTWVGYIAFDKRVQDALELIYKYEHDCTDKWYFNTNIACDGCEDMSVAEKAAYWIEAVETFRSNIAKMEVLGYELQSCDFAVEDMLDTITDILESLKTDTLAAPEAETSDSVYELPEDVTDESYIPFPTAA